MSFPIVLHRSSSQHRDTSSGLQRFLQQGGAIRPFEMTNTVPDPEAAGLMTNDQLVRKYEQPGRGVRITSCATVLALLGAVAVSVALVVTVYRINSHMDAMRSSIGPHAEMLVNSTLQMVLDTRTTLHNLKQVSNAGSQIVDSNVPQINSLTNNTVDISSKIAALLAHPEIKLSLAG